MAPLKTWVSAFRLRTLPLALSSIMMGTFLAISKGYFDVLVFILGVITTIFLQILSNLANDYGDASSGVDSHEREGPQRTVQAGLISKEAMKKALFLFVALSLVSGLLLIWVALGERWKEAVLFLILGFASIGAAIKYTVGKNPYGYAGWGDFFVMVFFGFVGVSGSFYLLVGSYDPLVILPSLSTGFFSVAVLNVNNIRDIESDKKSGKYSLPVRLGRAKAVLYHWSLLFLGFLASAVFVLITGSTLQAWVFIGITPLLFINARAVSKKTLPSELDPYLKQMAITTLLYVVLFGIGQIQF